MADDSYNVELVLTANNRISGSIGGVTRDMGNLDRSLKSTDQSAGTLTRGFTRLQQAMELGIAGAMLQRVGNLASEMYSLGNQVRIASTTFENLSGGAEQADSMMNMLRQSTGGMINDLALMQGASKYLSMGLGETSGEVSRLIELAVKLGGAMGNSASQSIEDFALLLANESVLRLDTFGISSARVRERIDELLASGEALNRSDAFRMAVMEQGAASLDRLGMAAEAAGTPIARLQVRLENLWATLSNNFAGVINGGAQVIESTVNRAADNEQVLQMASQMFGIPYETALGGLIGGVNPFTQAQLDAARAVVQQYEEATQQAAQEIADGAAAAEAEAQATIQRQLQSQAMDSYYGFMSSGYETFNRYNSLGTNAAGGQEWQFNRQYATTAEATQLRDIANEAVTSFEYLKGLFDQGLINEAAIQQAENLKNQLDQTADNAERAAQAFENMTLSQAFGEGGNTPLAGDLSSSFLQAAQGLDLGGDQYQQLADTIMLSTGEITDASLTYRDEVIPLLLQVYQQLGADASASALQNVEQYLRDAALNGYSADTTAAGLLSATGYTTIGGSGFGGTQFTVNPGDTASGIAARTGMTVDQILAAAGVTNPRLLQPGTYGAGGSSGAIVPLDAFDNPAGMAGMYAGADLAANAEAAADPFKRIEDSVSKAATDIDAINSTLDEINGKEVTVKLSLDTGNIPAWFNMLLEQANRDAGGTAPGTTDRGRSRVEAR